MKISKLSVIIPCYNEEKTIEKLVDLVLAAKPLAKEIIIVDDASKDGSREVLQKIKVNHPEITVLYKEKNRGKGHTLRMGFAESKGDYVIVQDADLEYDPNDYEKLIRELETGNVDVIYGSRFSGNYEQMSTAHYFGNKVLTLVTNLLYGVLLTDMETCYKLVPGDFIRNLKLKSDRFDFEPEITAKILKSGLRIREVPINYKGRKFSEGKKITWRDGFAAIATLIKYRFVN